MINKYININSNLILYEKLNNIYINNIYGIYLNKLKIILIIPSNIKHSNGFIAMLVLFEKNINNKPIFLFDYNTLSRNRIIKIGLIINIYGEILNQYLHLCMEYSIPRIIENNIIFNIPIGHIHYFYNNNKILYNSIFSFDKNMYLYYIYLSGLPYILEFNFYTTSRNKLINKLIMSNINEGVIIEENILKNILTDKSIIAAMEDELLNEETDEYIENIIEENTEENNIQEIHLNNNINYYIEYNINYDN